MHVDYMLSLVLYLIPALCTDNAGVKLC